MFNARIAGFILAVVLASPAAATTYNVTVLGAGGSAVGINDVGQVVGTDTQGQAVIWNGGTTTVLSTPQTGFVPTAINNSGQVVGYTTGSGFFQAALWNGGALTALSAPPGLSVSDSKATAINNSGQIVGTVSGTVTVNGIGMNLSQAVLWNGGTATVLNTGLNTSIPTSNSWASAINSAGQIAGSVSSGAGMPTIWNADGTVAQTFLYPISPFSGGQVKINNSGTVVGFSSGVGANVTSFSSAAGALLSLAGTVNFSIANAINDAGLVVGSSLGTSQSLNMLGTIWDSTTAIDVNSLLAAGPSGLIISALTGINSGGQIIGSGYLPDGSDYAVLLTPVAQTPLPAALPLFASGLGALWFAARRRTRKVQAATAD